MKKKDRPEWKLETYKQYWTAGDGTHEVLFETTISKEENTKVVDLNITFDHRDYNEPYSFFNMRITDLKELRNVLNNLIDKANKSDAYDVYFNEEEEA